MRLNPLHAIRNNRHPQASLLRGGIARCGYCGYALRPNYHAPRDTHQARTVYRCRRSLRIHADCSPHGMDAHLLDAAVWAKVCKVLRSPELIEQEVERMRATDVPGADVLAVIDKQSADLERRIHNKRKYAELVDDEKERAEVAAEVTELRKRLGSLEAERVAAAAHYAQWQHDQEGLQHTLDWCARVDQNLDSLSYDEKRGILLALKADVRLWRADHTPRATLDIWLPLSGRLSLDLSTPDAHCDEDGRASSHNT